MKYKDFEGALSRLEKIVGALEEGDLSLEEALKLFEEGVQVSRHCARVLKEAERKVEILTRNEEGEQETAPFQLSGKERGFVTSDSASATKRGTSMSPLLSHSGQKEE